MFRKNNDNNIGVRPVLGFLIDKGWGEYMAIVSEGRDVRRYYFLIKIISSFWIIYFLHTDMLFPTTEMS